MGTIIDQINTAFRDFITDGVSSSGPHEVVKAEVREIGPVIEAAISTIGLGALVDVIKDTKANLDADLAHAANTVALVYGDATDANNDIYVKVGGSGSGSWTNTGVLHSIISTLAQPYVDAAETAATGVEDMPLLAGVDGAISTLVLGSTTPNSTNSSAGGWSAGMVVPEGSRVSEIELRLSADMLADALLVDAGSRRVLAKLTGYNFVSLTPLANPFGLDVAAAPAIVMIVRSSGGFIRLAASTETVQSVAAGTYNVGDTLPAFTRTANYSLAMKVTYMSSPASAGQRLDRIERGKALAAAAAAGVGSTQVSVTPAHSAASVGASDIAKINAIRYVGRGVIRSIPVNFTAAASGVLEHIVEVDGQPKLVDRVAISVSSGASTVSLPGEGWAQRGVGYVAYRPLHGPNVAYGNTGGVYYDFGLVSAGAAIGDNLALPTLVNLDFAILIGLNVDAPAGARAFEGDKTGPALIDGQDFAGTATPGGWTVASPYSVSNSLIFSTGTPGLYFAGTNKATSIHKRRHIQQIKIVDTASIIGFACKPLASASGIGGAAVMIDGAAGALRLYPYSGSVLGSVAASTNFASALVANRIYYLETRVSGLTITATLTDSVTGTVTTVTGTFGPSQPTVRFHGAPGILAVSGNAEVIRTRDYINGPRHCRALITGDSNTEGSAAGVVGSSWAYQLAAADSDVIVSARSGESSTDAVLRLHELDWLRPAMLIYAHGTNDATQAEWRINTGAVVDACRALNIEMVICTPPPATTKQALVTAIANDATSHYFGRDVRVCDFLGALSNGGDRLTWNAAYQISGDPLHMDADGHTAALATVRRDVPELVIVT